MIVLNKPFGLAVQGGSGLTRHVDQMLEVLHRPAGAKAAARPPPRPRHGGRAARRPHALGRRLSRRGFQGARDAKNLLGDRRRRAASGRWAHLHLPRARGGARAHARREAWRGGRRPRGHALRARRSGRAEGVVPRDAADHRAHASASRARRAYRPSDPRRPEIFRHRELGAARRPAEPAASPRPAHRRSASEGRRDRRQRTAAAAHAADALPCSASTSGAATRRRRGSSR